jgi:23S rRNA pseudouridine2604 synthase
MSESISLTRRVAQLCACSYDEAEKVIADGGVSVDGVVASDAQRMIRDERIEIDPTTRPEAIEPATVILHKPAGVATSEAVASFAPSTRWTDDPSLTRMLPRHYKNLTMLMPLETDASGLLVLSQDGRVWRRLTEDADEIEQEFVVEVRGEAGPYALGTLARGLSYNGRPLPPCKVSWQSETRLRFAISNVQGGQLRHMCAAVGLELVTMRRLRIGRIPLTKLPIGEWRVLPAGEKF